MIRNLRSRLRRLLLGGGVSLTLSLAGIAGALGQAAPPPAPDAPAGSDEAAKAAKDDAKGAAAQNADKAKGAKGAAAEKSDPFAKPADDASKGARDTARDAAQGAQDSRDRVDESRDSARDRTEAARDDARDTPSRRPRNLREPGRQPSDSARDAADDTRDAAHGARDSARDRNEDARAARDLPGRERDDFREPGRQGRDFARDAADDVRDAARNQRDFRRDSARDDLRDSARDRRDDIRDSRDFSRDSRDRSREPGRDLRDDVRSSREFSRDSARGTRDSFRDEDRDLRAEMRGSRESSPESFRSSSRSGLNIRAEDIRSADIGLWFGRSTGDGLVISDIATSGPLASTISQIGFREGDRILSVDGYRITGESDFTRYLFADDVLNQRVPVVVSRDGRTVTLYVEPNTLVERMQTVQYDPLEQFGIVLDDRYTDRVVIWKVLPRSPAFYAGLQPGDVITTFHGQRLTGPQAFTQIVERVEPGHVALEINRNERVRQIDVDWPQIQAPTRVRSALRPDYDDPTIERLSERREDRIEDRRAMRSDGGTYVAPQAYAPGPSTGPVRRALFPRLRGR
jgi:PDZ domain-containing protein